MPSEIIRTSRRTELCGHLFTKSTTEKYGRKAQGGAGRILAAPGPTASPLLAGGSGSQLLRGLVIAPTYSSDRRAPRTRHDPRERTFLLRPVASEAKAGLQEPNCTACSRRIQALRI